MDNIKALELIRSNIEESGYHLYAVVSNKMPRYVYTIGLSETIGFELVFAGGVLLDLNEVKTLVRLFVQCLNKDVKTCEVTLMLEKQEQFVLSDVHNSWGQLLLLGAYDFYKTDQVDARQIIPTGYYKTIDVPDLSISKSQKQQPIWRFLQEKWDLPFPEDSKAITDIGVLKGEAVTELMRWENNEWEMFSRAGPDIPKDEIKMIPTWVLLAFDPSLTPATSVEINKGLWRCSKNDNWHDWG